MNFKKVCMDVIIFSMTYAIVFRTELLGEGKVCLAACPAF